MLRISTVGPVRTAARWFFAEPRPERSIVQVIAWWELRRILFNAMVATVAVPAFFLFFAFVLLSGELGPGEDAVEPFALAAAPFVLNVAYTAGWAAELTLRLLWRSCPPSVPPALLKLGLTATVAGVLLPAVLWGTVVTIQFLVGSR